MFFARREFSDFGSQKMEMKMRKQYDTKKEKQHLTKFDEFCRGWPGTNQLAAANISTMSERSAARTVKTTGSCSIQTAGGDGRVRSRACFHGREVILCDLRSESKKLLDFQLELGFCSSASSAAICRLAICICWHIGGICSSI